MIRNEFWECIWRANFSKSSLLQFEQSGNGSDTGIGDFKAFTTILGATEIEETMGEEETVKGFLVVGGTNKRGRVDNVWEIVEVADLGVLLIG